jgi:hypothetical protein
MVIGKSEEVAVAQQDIDLFLEEVSAEKILVVQKQ